MTENEQNLLTALRRRLVNGKVWTRPLDIGGAKNTHHSNTLRRMELPAKGWVESVERKDTEERPHRVYRITPKGLQALENVRALERAGR
jgi:hypothetical protein